MTQGKCTCGDVVQNQVDAGIHYYWCTSCGKQGKGASADSAWSAFMSSSEKVTRSNFQRMALLGQKMLERKAAPFIASDHPALDRLIKKNVEYVSSLSGKGYDDVWATEEGRESMMKALEESIELGATLPEMGSVVPYGGTAELIPDVEAFRFALTTGASSPFSEVFIEPVYQNDDVSFSRECGEFKPVFNKIPMSRGELAGIVVYCRSRESGKLTGDFLDIVTLDRLARKFSKPYQKSMRDVDDFIKARSEGKTTTGDDGREFIEKVIKGREGKKDWTKRIYFDEIDCPYTGPTAAKMYAKLAGKSYLGPYMKTRNSAAAIHELQSDAQRDESVVVSELVNRTSEAMTPPATTPAALAERASGGAEPVKDTVQKSEVKNEKAQVSTGKDDGLF